ncbi:hypothetical protein HOY80DRAFT_336695 [Tuber brumale]|nr:hypothetical protein HOY80DRAFT_336695 [Tuber brumale]
MPSLFPIDFSRRFHSHSLPLLDRSFPSFSTITPPPICVCNIMIGGSNISSLAFSPCCRTPFHNSEDVTERVRIGDLDSPGSKPSSSTYDTEMWAHDPSKRSNHICCTPPPPNMSTTELPGKQKKYYTSDATACRGGGLPKRSPHHPDARCPLPVGPWIPIIPVGIIHSVEKKKKNSPPGRCPPSKRKSPHHTRSPAPWRTKGRIFSSPSYCGCYLSRRITFLLFLLLT